MAIDATTYSPKEWSVWILEETTAGTSVLATTGMYQLDVDSVGFPTLNVTQALDVRTGDGRTLKAEDFFQDNKLRVVEFSLSGTLHRDGGHGLLLKNIANDFTTDVTIDSGWTPADLKYEQTNTAGAEESFTIVLKAPDHSNAESIVIAGCVVGSFKVSADAGTEGGRYKFEATIKSGKIPTLNESSTLAGDSTFSNTTDLFLSNATAKQVNNIDVVLQSFGLNIENDAVFAGFSTSGYEVVGRSAEVAVTAEASIKYDNNTKGLIHSFDTQTSAMSSNAFVITNTNSYGVDIQNAVFTDVSLNEGDFMQLNIAMKSVDDGADPLVTLDI